MKGTLFCILAIFLLTGISAHADETSVTVRVRGHDSKFVGSAMGGLVAVLRDAQTGAILDRGMIEGSTGDTDVLMKQPHQRETVLSQGGAAHWTATIDIEVPTLVRLETIGPLAAGTNQLSASQTFWVLPGQDIAGDGIIMELYGLVVHPASPGPHQMAKPEREIPIEADVVMMCGCNIKPESPWEPQDFKVKAEVRREGKMVAEIPLQFTGTPNRFAGKFQPRETGAYKIFITAAQPSGNNFGVGTTTIVVKD